MKDEKSPDAKDLGAFMSLRGGRSPRRSNLKAPFNRKIYYYSAMSLRAAALVLWRRSNLRVIEEIASVEVHRLAMTYMRMMGMGIV
jgi:hypothetical protein